MWDVVLPIYGALRGYTVVLRSEGMAHDHQRQCMGVYRYTGYHSDRPVYKQDEGENYLFYHNHSWLIGPRVGQDYAWIRNLTEENRRETKSASPMSSGSSSHSSSSDSDSSSDASSVGSAGQGSVKRYNKKKNLGLKSKTPDKYLGWQYRLRIGVDQDQWQDDTSLRIEALKDFDRVDKILQRVKTASRELD